MLAIASTLETAMKQAPISTQLPDGTEVLLRPVRPDDKPLLVQAMGELSEHSRRMRFLTPTARLSRSQLAYLTEVDQHDHQAWGIVVGGEPVAIARMVRINPTQAEVAITVIDEWQRRGIGELLTRFLAHLAREVGIEELVYIALPENQAINGLMNRFGVTGEFAEGLVTARLPVADVAPPRFLQTHS